MVQQGLMTITEYENLIPYEKDVYVMLLNEKLEIEREQALQEKLKQEAIQKRRF